MQSLEPVRHHRIKKIIIGIIIVPVALFLMLLIIGFVGSVFQRSQQIKDGNFSTNSSQTKTPTTVPYEGAQKTLIEGVGAQSIGATNPKLTIVEFADFACPYCFASFRAIREFGVRHPDTVKIIFRDWPGHTYSIQLATAAYCAGEQGKFWQMHDKLYAKQSDRLGADKNDIAMLAAEIGVYNQQFQNCYDEQKYFGLIQKNVADSETLGVKGTPTWFFNGQKVEGEISDIEILEKYFANYVK